MSPGELAAWAGAGTHSLLVGSNCFRSNHEVSGLALSGRPGLQPLGCVRKKLPGRAA